MGTSRTSSWHWEHAVLHGEHSAWGGFQHCSIREEREKTEGLAHLASYWERWHPCASQNEAVVHQALGPETDLHHRCPEYLIASVSAVCRSHRDSRCCAGRDGTIQTEGW